MGILANQLTSILFKIILGFLMISGGNGSLLIYSNSFILEEGKLDDSPLKKTQFSL